jgi:hypothetical protein
MRIAWYSIHSRLIPVRESLWQWLFGVAWTDQIFAKHQEISQSMRSLRHGRRDDCRLQETWYVWELKFARTVVNLFCRFLLDCTFERHGQIRIATVICRHHVACRLVHDRAVCRRLDQASISLECQQKLALQGQWYRRGLELHILKVCKLGKCIQKRLN